MQWRGRIHLMLLPRCLTTPLTKQTLHILKQEHTCALLVQGDPAEPGAHFHQGGSALLHPVRPLLSRLHRRAGQAAGPSPCLCPRQGCRHYRVRAGCSCVSAVPVLPEAAHCCCQLRPGEALSPLQHKGRLVPPSCVAVVSRQECGTKGGPAAVAAGIE